MTNRQLAAAETRKKLVDTAKAIICDKGLTNTSVEEMTEACGVSKGTFYTYFKRKEDIVFELSRGMFDEILENAEKQDGTVVEKLEYYMTHFAEYIEKSSVKLAQEWVKNVVDPDISEIGINKLAKDSAAVYRLLQLALEAGELKDGTSIKNIAADIVELLYGQMLCWALSGGKVSYKRRTEEFCKAHLAALLNGYLTEKGE